MEISSKTKIGELLAQYPFLMETLVELSPKCKLLQNPVARKTIGNVATLAQVAVIGGIDVNTLIVKLTDAIQQVTGSTIDSEKESIEGVAGASPGEAKHELLKAIIRSLHEGGDFDEAKRMFSELIHDVDAAEIAEMEQRLISEGMPQEEVKRLCDVHVQVFKDSIDVREAPVVAPGHPIHTMMAGNRALEMFLDSLSDLVRSYGTPPSEENYRGTSETLSMLLGKIAQVDAHYLRKENQLFPILERHNVSAPSQVMWSLDDDIRAMIKKCASLHHAGDLSGLVPRLNEMLQALRDMIYKEEKILFPMAMDTLTPQEWDAVHHGEEEIGYSWIAPESLPKQVTTAAQILGGQGRIPLSIGSLTLEQLDLMLTSLPLDISFVDENDEVRYYSATRERLFPRSAGVIGRKVQNCHPPKSMPVVQKILDDFKSAVRSTAEFWIQHHGRFVHIRYFALRNAAGCYVGCLEVVQDVTEIRALEGEKRLDDAK